MPSGNGDSPRPSDGAAQLGGVRADFVANLGRRLAEVRRHWAALEADPGSPRARDEVRRRIHALAVRARVVGLSAMADRLDSAERGLERASSAGGIDHDDIGLFRSLFDDLPALAWHEVGASPASLSAQPPAQHLVPQAPAQPVCPLAVLVVGDPALASAICSDDSTDRMTAIDCEYTADLTSALDLARALAPDVVLLDADFPGIDRFLGQLADDPLTGSVPVVVVGSWEFPDQAGLFLARGVTQALPRPVSPARLRAVLTEAARLPRPVDTALPSLDGTVADIADQLADQVRRGLVEALQPGSRSARLQLGEGTEAFAAVWGAVARIREILTASSDGAVEFTSAGPIGAVPMAPWMDARTDQHLSRRNASPRESLAAPARLDGRRVLVIDDDPAVTWFFSDLFRASGATVVEARDGTSGLEAALRSEPDLVVTDILMPGLDGFALCRALKNDVVLRDVPVILLSWKEDLLQRVRDLGASADGYLRKEASAAAILRKVHELLRPRIRLEERLAGGGEVRGRLDGWTALSLVRIVASSRQDAVLSLRDANFLYELTLRDRRVTAASRTAFDGANLLGVAALSSLPGVSSGRFQITTPRAQQAEGDLEGAIATIVARARAACVLLTGPALATVRQVRLRVDELSLHATPEPARTWLRALADGISPQELTRSHGAAPAMLERVLIDAAMRGAIEGVIGDDGSDWLASATMARASGVAAPGAASALGDAPSSLGASPPTPQREPEVPHDLVDLSAESILADVPPAPTDQRRSALFSDPPPNYLDAPVDGDAPTSLAEAVIREVADARGSLPPPSSRTPFLVDVHDLKPRTALPGSTGSLPPDAIVPGAEAGDPDVAVEPAVPSTPSIPPPARTPAGLSPANVDPRSTPLPAGHAAPPAQAAALDAERPSDAEDATPRSNNRARESRPWGNDPDAAEEPDRKPTLSGGARWWPTGLLLLIVLASVIAVARLATPVREDSSPRTAPVTSAPSVPSLPAASPASRTPAVEPGLALPDDLHVEAGMGVIEVRPGSDGAVVSIDGVEVGTGDVVRSVVTPGEHEVVVDHDGRERRAIVTVAATRRTRVSMEGTWTP